MNPSDEEFVDKIQQQLSTNIDDIDEPILLRLKQARANAIQLATQQQAEKSVETLRFPAWLAPASSVATFATIVFVTTTIWVQPPMTTQLISSESIIEDITLLSSSDDLDLYENLDFYIWLESDDTTS